MEEKGEENTNSEELKNQTNTDPSNNDDIKTSSPIINPELESIKPNNKNKPKIEAQKEKKEEKYKIVIPNRQNIVYNEDIENLIDISNEIEMITDELKETY